MALHTLCLEPLEDRTAPAAFVTTARAEADVRVAAQMIAAPVPPLPTVTLMPSGGGTVAVFELAFDDAAVPEADVPPVPDAVPDPDAVPPADDVPPPE